jgi:hypothetical protein
MLDALKKLFGIKAAEAPAAEVPYKVETPVVSTTSEQASQAVIESIAPAQKPVAKKTPAAKKPRAPRKPKAAK